MKRAAVWILLLILCVSFSARAELSQDPILDCALSMLEKGNIFIQRYNELTGAQIQAVFDGGLPYFFGGRASAYLFSKAPRYRMMKCQVSSSFFRKDEVYLYGLDCSGFTQYVYKTCGLPAHDTLENMLLKWDYQHDGNHLYDQHPGSEMPPFPELKDHLRVGDLFVCRHEGARYRHIMLYIGTLRDFGFTPNEAPELLEYLDYPLVIHCGLSPVYGQRMQQYIDDHPELYRGCHTTDGGVQVSILGVPPEEAPIHEHVQNTDYAYYLLNSGQCVLTVYDVFTLSSYCWFRM